jgi:trans-2,3-dihydro-3-hydroxyanthranilate isomerase
MPTHTFYTADVFTSRRFGGNPLAVFPEADAIDPAAMPAIAREFNFSETAFVLRPDDPRHTRRVRIFTLTGEVAFAGHPTIGTACVLASAGLVELDGDATKIVLEEGVGPVPVTIRRVNGSPGFAQLTVAQLPEFGPPPPAPVDLARALSIDVSDIRADVFHPEGATCGWPILFVPLWSREALKRARPDLGEWDRVVAPYWAQMTMVFCAGEESARYHARVFAPTFGVLEDPATGSACAALGGYLAKRDGRRDGTLEWVIEQGADMGRPSIIEIEVDMSRGAVTAVRVGGNSVIVTKGEFTLDHGK